MSITLELEGDGKKLGKICERGYRNGPSCPLILRQSSEDLLTANVFGLLRRLRPALWLEPMLRAAFPRHDVPRLRFKDVTLALWKKIPAPAERAVREGFTEVDVYVAFGVSVLLVESKFTSSLTPATAHDAQRDQLIRLIHVAFSHLVDGEFFPRAPLVLVLGVWGREPRLVTTYRNPDAICASVSSIRSREDGIAIARMLSEGVAYLSWQRLARLLSAATQQGTALEAALLKDLVAYITAKARISTREELPRQLDLRPDRALGYRSGLPLVKIH